jgi:hypothetical protein
VTQPHAFEHSGGTPRQTRCVTTLSMNALVKRRQAPSLQVKMNTEPSSIDSLAIGWGHTPDSMTVVTSKAGGGKISKLPVGGDMLISGRTGWLADYQCHPLLR